MMRPFKLPPLDLVDDRTDAERAEEDAIYERINNGPLALRNWGKGSMPDVREHLREIARRLRGIDGDRDPTAGSNLTVAQVIALAAELENLARD